MRRPRLPTLPPLPGLVLVPAMIGAALVAIVGNLLFAEQGKPLWQFNLFMALVIVFACGMILGRHLTNQSINIAFGEVTAGLPKQVTFHRDDDSGQMTAFVTTVSGDLRTILMPDGIESRDDAMAYIIEQLTGQPAEATDGDGEAGGGG